MTEVSFKFKCRLEVHFSSIGFADDLVHWIKKIWRTWVKKPCPRAETRMETQGLD